MSSNYTDVEPPSEAQLANEVICRLRPGKVVPLGIQLGLSLEDIDAASVKDLDHFNQYMTVFNRWKRSGHGVVPYTWKSLVKALKAPSVREMELGRKIQRDYC